jgi:glutamyl/glutaminyl-tRNA synthetase
MQDTDEARSTRASEDSMVQDLKWLGLDWDEVRLVVAIAIAKEDRALY